MHDRLRAIFLLIGGLSLGCSSSAPIAAGPNDRLGPHRGMLVALPEDQGYAEILNSQSKERGGVRSRPATQVLVYFLSPDLKAPASASASDVVVKLTLVTDQPETVPLEPAPEEGDPVGKKRFASKSGPYSLSGVHGELNANVAGKPFRAEFDGSR